MTPAEALDLYLRGVLRDGGPPWRAVYTRDSPDGELDEVTLSRYWPGTNVHEGIAIRDWTDARVIRFEEYRGDVRMHFEYDGGFPDMLEYYLSQPFPAGRLRLVV